MPANLQSYEAIGLLMIGIGAFLPVATAVLGLGVWAGRIARTAQSAEKTTEALRERTHTLANDLASYKREVSDSYVKNGALEKLEGRIMGALSDIGRRIDSYMTGKGE